MALRSILYADVVQAASKVAAIMIPGRYVIDTAGGSTAAVSKAYGGGYRISLPTLPATARLSRTEANYILGLLVHELGHVRYTDFNLFPADRDLMDMLNSVEDIREETAIMSSGAPPNGAELLAQVTETMSLRALAMTSKATWSKYPKGRALGYAVCILGRLANPAYGPLPATTAYTRMIPAWASALCAQYMPEILALRSTAEALDLATRMLAALPAEVPADQPSDEPGEGEPGEGEPGEGEPGEGEPDREPEPSDEPGDKPSDEPSDQPSDAPSDQPSDKPGEASDTPQGGHSTADTEPAPVAPFDPRKVLADMLKPRLAKATADDQADARHAGNITTTDGLPHETKQRAARARTDRPGAKVYRDNAKVAGLAPKVRQMLHSQDDSLTTRYETRGRLDRRAVGRLGTGDPRVFTRRTASDGIRTAVGFLVDCSSSMGTGMFSRFAAQASAAIALGDACVRGGADVALWGFGPDANTPGAGVLLPFKTWSESMDDGAARLAGHGAPHGTNLSPSLLAAARAMADRAHVDKRILLVMTDGGCSHGPGMLRAAANFAAGKYGVTVVGVGIQCDVDAFPLRVRVDNIATLASVTMKALIKVVG